VTVPAPPTRTAVAINVALVRRSVGMGNSLSLWEQGIADTLPHSSFFEKFMADCLDHPVSDLGQPDVSTRRSV
jgi:hypothetical protein